MREPRALLGRYKRAGLASTQGRERDFSVDVERCVAAAGRPHGDLDVVVLGVAAGEGAVYGECRRGLGGSQLVGGSLCDVVVGYVW